MVAVPPWMAGARGNDKAIRVTLDPNNIQLPPTESTHDGHQEESNNRSTRRTQPKGQIGKEVCTIPQPRHIGTQESHL
uniref:Uncharacterized protein n=1 Tax=Leersia perrieri TaxID=77586 RepID=A0A0D9VL93_9ORYZ